MIKYIKKDITTVEDGIIIHGCNCSGGFGSGVARAIKKKWPRAEKIFRNRWKKGNEEKRPTLGGLDISTKENEPTIVNAYTQKYYGYDGKKYADTKAIETVLYKLIKNEYITKDVYMPKIGCGLGGLKWEADVRPIIEEFANNINYDVYICEI